MIEEKWKLLLDNLQQEFKTAHVDLAYRYINEIFAKYVPSGSKVLDIGCGEGPEEVKILKDHGYETIGITIQPWMSTKYNIQIMDMHDLNFLPKSFDAIYSSMVFEHSYAPWLAVAEAWIILKDSGIFFLALPRHDQYLCTAHPTMLTEERWEFILKHIGFDILNNNRYFSIRKNHALVEIIYFVCKKTKPSIYNTIDENTHKMDTFLAKLEFCHLKKGK